MEGRPDPLAVLRGLVVRQAGGYLRNVIWDDRTCPYCAGIPGNPDFSSCYACGGFQHRTDLSDRRGFLTYGVEGAQSGSLMYRYKDQVPPQAATRTMTVLLAYALTVHVRCATDPVHGPVVCWTTVPSLGGRDVHPLPAIARPFLEAQNLPEVALGVAQGAQKTRSVHPENFIADPGQVTGRHVLLLEDTWVTGSNPEGAAAALKAAGAASVSLLVVARWLKPGRGDTKDFIQKNLTTDYDPDACAFTGAGCP